MAYSQTGLIQASDYNLLIEAINPIFGLGNGPIGYGGLSNGGTLTPTTADIDVVDLPTKSVGNSIVSADWINLKNAYLHCAAHQGITLTVQQKGTANPTYTHDELIYVAGSSQYIVNLVRGAATQTGGAAATYTINHLIGINGQTVTLSTGTTVDDAVTDINAANIYGIDAVNVSTALQINSSTGARNLLTVISDFNTAPWTSGGVGTTVSTDFTYAPDDTKTADKVTFNAGGGGSASRDQVVTAVTLVDQQVTVSVWAKVESGTRDFRLGIWDNVSLIQVGIKTATTKWQKFSFTGTFSATSTSRYFELYNNTGATAGDIIFWEAKLELGDGFTNLLLRSEELDNASSWVRSNVLAVQSGITTPYGTSSSSTADSFFATLTAGYLYQSITVDDDTGTYTGSIYLKASSATVSLVKLIFTGGTAVFTSAIITWAGPSTDFGNLVDVGDGWYRLDMPTTNNGLGNTTLQFQIFPGGNVDTSVAVVAWGADLKKGSTVSPYVATTTAAASRGIGPAGADLVLTQPGITSSLLNTFSDPTVETSDNFGKSVAISGNLMIVGAPNDDTSGANVGQAHLYNATTFALLNTFSDPTVTTSDNFGIAVAIDANYVLIGSPYDDTIGTDYGQAHLFNATTFALIHTFDNPVASGTTKYGSAVSVSGNHVLIGASDDSTDGILVGRAYQYNATTGSLVKTYSDPVITTNDRFGESVSVSGNHVLIGAPRGATGFTQSGQAYLFNATTFVLAKTFANPTPAVNDFFGYSTSVSGNHVVIGAVLANSSDGEAYLFNATTFALVHTFNDPSASADNFGTSVSVDGNFILIGAPLDDTGWANLGQAHLYDATTFSLIQTYDDPTITTGDQFGASVAISGTKVLIGARLDDTSGTDVGQAHLFTIDFPSTALSDLGFTPGTTVRPANYTNAVVDILEQTGPEIGAFAETDAVVIKSNSTLTLVEGDGTALSDLGVTARTRVNLPDATDLQVADVITYFTELFFADQDSNKDLRRNDETVANNLFDLVLTVPTGIPAAARDDYSGTVGTKFTVGSKDIVINSLGYQDDGGGLTLSHFVGLWTVTPTLERSVTVPSGTVATQIGSWRFSPITEFTLLANTTYWMGATVSSSSGDPWTDGVSVAKFGLSPKIIDANPTNVSNPSPATFPNNDGGATDLRWAPANAAFINDGLLTHGGEGYAADALGTSTRATAWSTQLEHKLTVTFASQDAARAFFNTGGTIGFYANHQGNGLADPDPSFAQWTAWDDFLQAIEDTPDARNPDNWVENSYRFDAIDYFALTAGLTNVVVYGSDDYLPPGPYADPGATMVWTIQAATDTITDPSGRGGNGSVITFRSIFTDNHVGTGGGPDSVTGTMDSIITSYRADDIFQKSSPTYGAVIELTAGT